MLKVHHSDTNGDIPCRGGDACGHCYVEARRGQPTYLEERATVTARAEAAYDAAGGGAAGVVAYVAAGGFWPPPRHEMRDPVGNHDWQR